MSFKTIARAFAIGERVRRKSKAANTYDHFYVGRPIHADREYIVIGEAFVQIQRGGGGDSHQKWTCVPLVEVQASTMALGGEIAYADASDLERVGSEPIAAAIEKEIVKFEAAKVPLDGSENPRHHGLSTGYDAAILSLKSLLDEVRGPQVPAAS